MNLNHILTMGNYGIYVWPAYGITFLVLGYNLIQCLLEKKRILKHAKRILVDKS